MFNIAICDDDEKMCAQIEHHLADYTEKQQVSTEIFFSAEKLYRSLLDGAHYDLIFLDIEFRLMNGVEVGKRIREELKDETVQIVYVSSIQSYAMELFEIRPLNFLIKPVRKEKIISSVEKAMKLSAYYKDCFEFGKGKSRYREPYGDILYFESSGRKICFYTRKGKQELYGKMNEIEAEAPDCFIRIHQSYLINRAYVKKWEYEKAYLSNGMIFSISQSYRKSVRTKIFNQNTENF